ncbi:MAG: hypothetical protein ACQETA_09180 [Bacteroidota bacterium]
MDFLKWYKIIFESNELDPPHKTWDHIQDQLDIDNSWQVINKRLNERARSALRIRVAAAASLLILVAAGASWIYFSSAGNAGPGEELAEEIVQEVGTNQGGKLAEEIVPGVSSNKGEEPAEEIVQEVSPGKAEDNKQTTLPVLAENILRDAGEGDTRTADMPAVREDVLSGEEAVIREEALTKMAGRGAGSLTVYTPEDKFEDIIPTGEIIRGAAAKTRKVFRKFYLGTTGQLANTWLVNEKTISGFKSASLVSTNATFGSNFGFFAGTNLVKNVDLQADFNILAQNNQDYNEYMDGNYVTNKLKLDYSQLALSLRYNLMSQRFMEGEHGVNFGGYLAYLHNAYQKIDGDKLYLSDNYNNIDYGLMLGYEYVFPLAGQLGLGTGFRAYYGLSNIYSGDENIPSYMNVTNNASVNITLSFKYLLR